MQIRWKFRYPLSPNKCGKDGRGTSKQCSLQVDLWYIFTPKNSQFGFDLKVREVPIAFESRNFWWIAKLEMTGTLQLLFCWKKSLPTWPQKKRQLFSRKGTSRLKKVELFENAKGWETDTSFFFRKQPSNPCHSKSPIPFFPPKTSIHFVGRANIQTCIFLIFFFTSKGYFRGLEDVHLRPFQVYQTCIDLALSQQCDLHRSRTLGFGLNRWTTILGSFAAWNFEAIWKSKLYMFVIQNTKYTHTVSILKNINVHR